MTENTSLHTRATDIADFYAHQTRAFLYADETRRAHLATNVGNRTTEQEATDRHHLIVRRTRRTVGPGQTIGSILAGATESVVGGFVVGSDGELSQVWSNTRGVGDFLVDCAILSGATHLDCFEGHLTDLYGRHCFVETRREANWTPGGPDVVWMTLDAAAYEAQAV